jgi:hypothetical protein
MPRRQQPQPARDCDLICRAAPPCVGASLHTTGSTLPLALALPPSPPPYIPRQSSRVNFSRIEEATLLESVCFQALKITKTVIFQMHRPHFFRSDGTHFYPSLQKQTKPKGNQLHLRKKSIYQQRLYNGFTTTSIPTPAMIWRDNKYDVLAISPRRTGELFIVFF